MLDILSLEDLEPAAERYLPHCIFSFISGAVETNATRHENRAAFQDYDFHPRVLIDVSARTTATTLFGETFSAPFGIAPMGGSGLAGYRADLALASGAAAENVPFILSGASLVRMEEVAQANPRTWFQAYLPVERDAIGALIDRVKAAGYRHLVVTADVPVGGNRENLVRAGYTSPLRPTLKLALDAATHPRWLFGNALRTLRHHGMPYYENSGVGARHGGVLERRDPRPYARLAVLARSRIDPRALGGQADREGHPCAGGCARPRAASAATA